MLYQGLSISFHIILGKMKDKGNADCLRKLSVQEKDLYCLQMNLNHQKMKQPKMELSNLSIKLLRDILAN